LCAWRSLTSFPETLIEPHDIRKRIRLALDEASGPSPTEKLRYFARRAGNRVKSGVAKLEKAGCNLKELFYKTLRKREAEKADGGPSPLKLPVWIMLHRVRCQDRWNKMHNCSGVGGDTIYQIAAVAMACYHEIVFHSNFVFGFI
jgi:hypothetical protein